MIACERWWVSIVDDNTVFVLHPISVSREVWEGTGTSCSRCGNSDNSQAQCMLQTTKYTLNICNIAYTCNIAYPSPDKSQFSPSIFNVYNMAHAFRNCASVLAHG